MAPLLPFTVKQMVQVVPLTTNAVRVAAIATEEYALKATFVDPMEQTTLGTTTSKVDSFGPWKETTRALLIHC